MHKNNAGVHATRYDQNQQPKIGEILIMGQALIAKVSFGEKPVIFQFKSYVKKWAFYHMSDLERMSNLW